MANPAKSAAVLELTEEFRSSNAAVLTEYRGLTVSQLKELRRSLLEHAHYTVVKNTLTKIAAREAGVDAFEDLLQGPSAIAFVKGDPVEAAKGLRAFARANPLLVIKAGVLDGKSLTAAEISQLADLESREVLLAKMAGAMVASLTQAAALFQAPLSQAARVVEALRQKAEQEPGVLAVGAVGAVGADTEPSPTDTVTSPAVTEPGPAVTEPGPAVTEPVSEAAAESPDEAPVEGLSDNQADNRPDVPTDIEAETPTEL